MSYTLQNVCGSNSSNVWEVLLVWEGAGIIIFLVLVAPQTPLMKKYSYITEGTCLAANKTFSKEDQLVQLQ